MTAEIGVEPPELGSRDAAGLQRRAGALSRAEPACKALCNRLNPAVVSLEPLEV